MPRVHSSVAEPNTSRVYLLHPEKECSEQPLQQPELPAPRMPPSQCIPVPQRSCAWPAPVGLRHCSHWSTSPPRPRLCIRIPPSRTGGAGGGGVGVSAGDPAPRCWVLQLPVLYFGCGTWSWLHGTSFLDAGVLLLRVDCLSGCVAVDLAPIVSDLCPNHGLCLGGLFACRCEVLLSLGRTELDTSGHGSSCTCTHLQTSTASAAPSRQETTTRSNLLTPIQRPLGTDGEP